ncbi:MAG: DUF1194 domain-containing protein [Verrucomicrobiota bacterium]
MSATAESVDSELLILVDASRTGLRNGEFSALLEGYSNALTSSEVLDSIASGATGKIAVSLSFFNTRRNESAGIPWMVIGSAAEAQAFATGLQNLSRPRSGSFRYQQALEQSLLSFGTETGGPIDNGFQSAVQIVEVAGARRLPGNVAGATDQALAQGVDMIGATVVGRRSGRLDSYYADNVIGGGVGDVVASVSSSPVGAGLADVLEDQLSYSVGGGAISSVPEPSSAILAFSSMGMFFLFGRKRRA